jgi:ABC-type Zn uptake system ZnuABC Zn-binding protein ZnuA
MSHLTLARSRGVVLLAVLVIVLLAPAFAGGQPALAGGQKLEVVATFSVLGDFVHQVGGDKVDLSTIVPPGGDAHTFDPKPDQVAQVAQADLIFEIGVGFEPWLDDLYNASGSSAKRVAVTDGMNLIAADHEAGVSDAKPGIHDPHVWHDVNNAIMIVQTIEKGLSAKDPANAATYQANAKAYLAQLAQLNAWVKQEVAKIPPDQRKLVTSHDTFAYFARAYGFQIIGTAFGSLSTEQGEPSAKDVANLIKEIKAAHVPAIFAENVSNPKLMQQIADEAGVKLGPDLYTDALGPPGSSGDTYLKMMHYNVSAIVTALTS